VGTTLPGLVDRFYAFASPLPASLAVLIQGSSMEKLAFVLDIFLVVAGVAAFIYRPRIGGELAKGLRLLTIGIMVLGFAHLAETILFAVFYVARPLNEVIHRLFVGAGFVFVVMGFARMRKAFYS
jgi:hypothetical protein